MKINDLKKGILLLIVLFISNVFYAQQNKQEEVGLELLSDESLFVGGFSTNVLQQGQVEINMYSALFSSWLAYHESPIEDSPIRDRYRFTEFTTNLDVYLGSSVSGRWDVGLRLKYARRRFDNQARSSPFRVFQSNEEGSSSSSTIDRNYSGLKEVGLRFRLLPLKNIPALTLTGGYSFSPIKAAEDQRGLDAERNNFDVNLSYYLQLNNNSYYYFIANGLAYHPSSNKDEWLYNAAGSFYLLQLVANRKIAFYPGLSYSIGFKPPAIGDQSLIWTTKQLLGVLGVQFQPSNNFNINISTAIPFILDNSNLVEELVRESYSFITLGGRLVF